MLTTLACGGAGRIGRQTFQARGEHSAGSTGTQGKNLSGRGAQNCPSLASRPAGCTGGPSRPCGLSETALPAAGPLPIQRHLPPTSSQPAEFRFTGPRMDAEPQALPSHPTLHAPAGELAEPPLAAATRPEHFIACRQADLVELVCGSEGLTAGERDAIRRLADRLSSALHFEYHAAAGGTQGRLRSVQSRLRHRRPVSALGRAAARAARRSVPPLRLAAGASQLYPAAAGRLGRGPGRA